MNRFGSLDFNCSSVSTEGNHMKLDMVPLHRILKTVSKCTIKHCVMLMQGCLFFEREEEL